MGPYLYHTACPHHSSRQAPAPESLCTTRIPGSLTLLKGAAIVYVVSYVCFSIGLLIAHTGLVLKNSHVQEILE